MAQVLTPLAKIQLQALQACTDALDTLLFEVGTQHARGNYDQPTYNEAERLIQADMKALSDRAEAITGQPLALFA